MTKHSGKQKLGRCQFVLYDCGRANQHEERCPSCRRRRTRVPSTYPLPRDAWGRAVIHRTGPARPVHAVN